jgi:hypothetical protein
MEHYAKLFDLSWVEPWLVEALIVIFGALLLGVFMCQVAEWINGDNK